jgi:hypothetical protein
MKHPLSRHPWLALLTLTALAGRAHAEDCPTSLPADAGQRRTLAKRWFGDAEEAERRSDEVAALRAYQCSLRLVPHAFTAYNLARVAEQTGDLELAIESYHMYLGLKTNAEDAAEVTAHLAVLEQRVADLRAQAAAAPPLTLKAIEATPPSAVAVAPRDEPAPPVHFTLRRMDWIVGSAAAGALVLGVTFNLVARAKMSDCRSLADADRFPEALSSCSNARPAAYASYALLTAAGVAALADTVVVLVRARREHLAVIPIAGGARLAWRGRF